MNTVPPQELWSRSVLPWLEDFFSDPLAKGKNRKMELMKRQLESKKILDNSARDITAAELQAIGLPATYLTAANMKPDVGAILIFEARLSTFSRQFLHRFRDGETIGLRHQSTVPLHQPAVGSSSTSKTSTSSIVKGLFGKKKENLTTAGLVPVGPTCTTDTAISPEVGSAASLLAQCTKKFELYALCARVLQRTVCFHVQSFREQHHHCSEGSCQCWNEALRFSSRRHSTVEALLIRCWGVELLPRLSPYVLLFLTQTLPSVWDAAETMQERTLLHSVVKMLVAVDETEELVDVMQFTLTQYCSRLLARTPPSTPEAVGVFSSHLYELSTRTAQWLPPSLIRKVVAVVVNVLVADHHDALCTFVGEWLISFHSSSLRAIYHLYHTERSVSSTVAGLPTAAVVSCHSNSPTADPYWFEVAFKEAVATELENALRDGAGVQVTTFPDGKKLAKTTDPHGWYGIVRDWKAKYEEVIQSCFNADKRFQKALRFAAESVLAPSNSVVAQVIHVALTLQKDPIEEVSHLIEWLLPFIQEQDAMMAEALVYMATRLISPSVNIDGEKTLLARLRPLLMIQDVRPMLQMVKDYETSAELSEEFARSSSSSSNTPSSSTGRSVHHRDPADLQANSFAPKAFQMLVASAAWKGLKPVRVRFPAPLERTLLHAQQFYQKRFQHRLLGWQHCSGYIVIKLRYTKIPYELTLPPVGGALLLAFDALLVGESGIRRGSLVEMLIPESLPRETDMLVNVLLDKMVALGVLQRLPAEATASSSSQTKADEVLVVNKSFVHRQKVRKINLLPKSTGPASGQVAVENAVLMKQRECVLQATIVRIMKAKRELEHQKLYLETVNQVKARFFPNMPQVKRVIEHLLEAEYLQRKDSDASVYQYLA